MFSSELIIIFIWWLMLFVISLAFQPLSFRIFRNFFDKGYIFSKILGMAILTYMLFMLGSLHLIPFTQFSVIGLLLFSSVLLFILQNKYLKDISLRSFFPIILLEESLFFTILLFWSYVRGFNPDIHGLEKFMDFGFINSILRSEFLPPKDMWLTPFSINYYYFGHLVTAVLTKLSGIPASFTFNLMLASICGLCFTSAFSIGANLTAFFLPNIKRFKLKILFAGLLTALLVTFGGNLHTLYTFFKPYENEKPVPFWQLEPISNLGKCDPNWIKGSGTCSHSSIFDAISSFPNSYWYPNATRFISHTIHEFPIYSWVVADLHGHVLDIPFVLLTIAVLLAIFQKFQISNFKLKITNEQTKKTSFIGNWKSFDKLKILSLPNGFEIGNLIFTGFLLAIMYMTNAWDGIIYLLLAWLLLFISVLQAQAQKINSFFLIVSNAFLPTLLSSAVVFASFIIFSLPFSLHFKPFVSGIGILCAPQIQIEKIEKGLNGEEVTNANGIPQKVKVPLEKIGPFLLEKDHCQQSPPWQLVILYGFFIFFAASFLAFIIKQKKLSPADTFIFALILLSFLLIMLPEFIYVKDIYPAHYRANTMFKLVFQAFIMLSIVSGYTIVRILSSTQTIFKTKTGKFVFALFLPITIGLLTLVFIYPFLATKAYYNNLQGYKGLDGTKYLQTLYPDDYKAISWINLHIAKQPVILEAQGDSYTDYARISTNTGLPTILGWTVHEWLWRGQYDYDVSEDQKKLSDPTPIYPAPRIADVKSLYESKGINETKLLLKKYDVQYIYIGRLEREKYPELYEQKWQQLGKQIFLSGEVRIYKI